jgi:hypothetical protein
MSRVTGWLKSFGAFWYDFVIGDDWHVAAIVVVALAVTALLVHQAGVNAWWLMPLAVFGALAWSLRRATRNDPPSLPLASPSAFSLHSSCSPSLPFHQTPVPLQPCFPRALFRSGPVSLGPCFARALFRSGPVSLGPSSQARLRRRHLPRPTSLRPL